MQIQCIWCDVLAHDFTSKALLLFSHEPGKPRDKASHIILRLLILCMCSWHLESFWGHKPELFRAHTYNVPHTMYSAFNVLALSCVNHNINGWNQKLVIRITEILWGENFLCLYSAQKSREVYILTENSVHKVHFLHIIFNVSTHITKSIGHETWL